MKNVSIELCEIKQKVNIKLHLNTLIITDLYYIKPWNNIISLTKLMYKVFKISVKDDKI